MSQSNRPYRLLAPGPVPVPPSVLSAMSAKVLHHRTPEFESILKFTWEGLRLVFGTKQPVQIICGTGSAAMEAAVVNLLSPGDEVLVVVSGKFGERWADMCERYGARVRRWTIPWGHALDVDAFARELDALKNPRAVFTQVCETSTATLHPVREMARLTRARHPDALFAADAITALGCLPLGMDEANLDVVVAGSQKAFMIPTGLSFIALSERAWIRQAQSQTAKFYFDLAAERAANRKGETLFSTPTPLIVGLHEVLSRIRDVGLPRVVARAERLAEVTRRAGERLGLSTFSNAPSPSVTALVCPDGAAVRDRLEREYNITVMGGQDQLKGKILRVGHMGDVRDEDMTALFTALAEILERGDAAADLTVSIAHDLAATPALFT